MGTLAKWTVVVVDGCGRVQLRHSGLTAKTARRIARDLRAQSQFRPASWCVLEAQEPCRDLSPWSNAT